MFGPADGGPGRAGSSFEQLCARAGITLLVPPRDRVPVLRHARGRRRACRAVYDRMRERVLPAVLRRHPRRASCRWSLRRLLVHRGASTPCAGARPSVRVLDAVAVRRRARAARHWAATTQRIDVAGPAPDLLVDPDGPQPGAGDAWPRPSPMTSTFPRTGAAARSPGTAACCTPSSPPPRRRREAAEVARLDAHRARLLQPHLRTGHDPGHRQALPARAGATGSAGRPQLIGSVMCKALWGGRFRLSTPPATTKPRQTRRAARVFPTASCGDRRGRAPASRSEPG